MTTFPLWKNDEHDLYWRHDGREEWVNGVESLTVQWVGDAGEETGCLAEALLVVRMPSPITAFANGHDLLVVHNPCGQLGSGVYNQDDIRLRLERCAVLRKCLDSPFTQDPDHVELMGVALQIEGTMRLW